MGSYANFNKLSRKFIEIISIKVYNKYMINRIQNSGFDYAFFSSVVAVDKTIRETILKNITAKDYAVIGFTLTCSEETLLERHKKRGDKNECSFC